jgi:phenylacetic acid degradation protein
VGSPAKERRALTDDELAWKANGTGVYQALARRSLDTLQAVEPLTKIEEGRPSLSVSGATARPLREYREGAQSS